VEYETIPLKCVKHAVEFLPFDPESCPHASLIGLGTGEEPLDGLQDLELSPFHLTLLYDLLEELANNANGLLANLLSLQKSTST